MMHSFTRQNVSLHLRPARSVRRALVAACFVAACVSASVGARSVEQGCPPLDAHIKGWPQGAVVFYDAERLPPHVRVQVARAFEKWNAVNRADGSGVEFKPKTDAHAATFFFHVGTAGGDSAKTDIIKRDTLTVLQAFTVFDLGNRRSYDAKLEGYDTVFEKIALHEIGHTMGLYDVPIYSRIIECGGQSSGKSVMNIRCGINDRGKNMPTHITACDRKAVRANPNYRKGSSQ